jgi:RNA polymerase sigma-70 factor, ECF subfamily
MEEAVTPEVARAAADAVAAARARWSGLGAGLDSDGFAAYLGARVAPETSAPPAFAIDLFLAWACIRGDAIALRHFEREMLGEADRVLGRLGLPRADADDIKQELRTKLLIGGDGGKLASYHGAGPLASWVAAVAGRQGLGLLRRQQPMDSIEDDILDETDDPALAALKQDHRVEFKAAFQAAVAALEPRDRAILRALVVEDRTVGEIAAVYGIHRVTASRRISSIRHALLRDTRKQLRAQLDVDDRTLDSFIRLVDSNLEVSLVRLLGDAA